MKQKVILGFDGSAEVFPLLRDLDPERWADFCNSIATGGLIDPITVHQGKILDGRNRYLACLAMDIEPRFVEFETLGLDMLPHEYAFDRNMQRRDLTPDQRAAIAVQFDKIDRELAKERKRANLVPGFHKSSEGTERSRRKSDDKDMPAKARKKIADKAKVSERKAQQALNVQRDAPELLPKVARGELKLVDARPTKPTRKPKPHTSKTHNAVSKLCLLIEQDLDEAVASVPETERAFVASSLEAFAERLRAAHDKRIAR